MTNVEQGEGAPKYIKKGYLTLGLISLTASFISGLVWSIMPPLSDEVNRVWTGFFFAGLLLFFLFSIQYFKGKMKWEQSTNQDHSQSKKVITYGYLAIGFLIMAIIPLL